MDASTLGSAITTEPSIPFSVRLDPADAKRAVVATDLLLDPSTTYTVDVSTAALDVHGNQLYRNQSFVFTTGTSRPLRHWVAFATALADGSSGGVWIVNESGFPRRVFDGPSVHSFSWSPDGSTLLIQGDSLSWSAFTPSVGSTHLPFKAVWAAALAAGLGYVYIDVDGTLHRLSVDSADEVIASDVSDAASAPNGLRVAYVRSSGSTSTVWGYDVGLRSRYELVSETGPLSDLSWSPSGNRIAYLREDSGGIALRVRSFTGQSATTTVATGDIGHPTWLPDSAHVVCRPARGPDGCARDPIARHRSRRPGPVARRPPDRLREPEPGLDDERGRDAADGADAVRRRVVPLLLPDPGLDANLIYLDRLVE